MKTKARQFVYRYEGNADSEEVEQDLDGEIPVPQKDEVISRNGKQWRVVMVQTTLSDAIPVHRVFLTKA